MQSRGHGFSRSEGRSGTGEPDGTDGFQNSLSAFPRYPGPVPPIDAPTPGVPSWKRRYDCPRSPGSDATALELRLRVPRLEGANEVGFPLCAGEHVSRSGNRWLGEPEHVRISIRNCIFRVPKGLQGPSGATATPASMSPTGTRRGDGPTKREVHYLGPCDSK